MVAAKVKQESEFRCFDCSRTIKMRGVMGRIICPYCGSRILIKNRSGLPKHVKAR